MRRAHAEVDGGRDTWADERAEEAELLARRIGMIRTEKAPTGTLRMPRAPALSVAAVEVVGHSIWPMPWV
jgi:hypothetical protein